MAVTYETLIAELDNFGVRYEFPAYVLISNRSGFLSSGRFDEYGMLAADINGESLIFTENCLMSMIGGGQAAMNTVYRMSVDKIKINKALLISNYTIDIVYHSEGKKKHYKFSINTIVKGFPGQKENVINLINMLKKWA